MKAVVSCILTLGFVLTASSSPGAADEPKEEGIQCDTKHLDEKWNLQFKSITTQMVGEPDFEEVRIVFEFTKDVEADTVKRIGDAFERVGSPYVQFYFFDKDNVLISKRRFTSIKGEITGKSGEAFRVVIRCPRDVLAKTKKIEPRLSKDEK